MHILGQLPRGGAETLVLDICRNAKRNNLDMIVVAFDGGDLENEFQGLSIPFFLLKEKCFFDLSVMKKLRRLIQKESVRIIHSHSETGLFTAVIASLGLGVKKILHLHGLNFRSFTWPRKLLYFFLTHITDKNIAVSNSHLHSLGKLPYFKGLSNFKVLYNGIDLKKFTLNRGTLRQELKLPPHSVLLGMIGNFNWVRNQLFVCQAALASLQEDPNLFLIFAGSKNNIHPKYFQDCINFCIDQNIKDRVHFLGRREDIDNILSSLDIFVYASEMDTFGIAVVEAMYKNVPVLVNDITPFVEITDNGRYAQLYKSLDAEDFQRKLGALLAKTPSSNLNSSDWVKRMFSIESHINQLRILYATLVGCSTLPTTK